VLFWMAGRFWTKRTVYRQPWWGRLPFLWILVGLVIGMKFLPLRPARLLPITPVTDTAGIALCVLGLGWTIWARLVLGRNWSASVTLKENHELIQSGPYRVTRHPIYTGLLAAIAGTVLSLSLTVVGVLFLMLFTALLINKLRLEETLMLRQFPEAYPAFKNRVRAALVPFIW
jgi:protein-S-isoprenylcysteine O-methyltransferase Ste14